MSGPSVRLLRETLALGWRVPAAAAALVALAAAQLALPWLVKRWVEGPLASGDRSGAPGLVLAALGLAGLIAALLALSRLLVAVLKERLVERLRNAAVGCLLEAEPATVRGFGSGDLLSRAMQDAGMVASFVEALLKRVVGDGLLAVGAVAMMVALDPVLALASGLVVPAVAALLLRLGRVIRRRGHEAQRGLGRLTAVVAETVRGFTAVKGFQAEAFERSRFAGPNAAYRRQAVLAETWSGVLVAAVFLLATVVFLGAIALGTSRVAAGHLGAGGLLAFCLYAAQTVEPLRRLAEVHGQLQRVLAAATRVFEIVDLPLPEPPAHSVPSPGGRPCALRLLGVRFRHQPSRPLLEGVSLDVAAGERVALVAASGGGKSTLAALLLRYLEPSGGRLELDGADLGSLDLAVLRRRVLVVEQEGFVVAGSLEENLRYGRRDASRAELEAAAHQLGLGALETRVDEAGRDVSGGQRQRVALARAVLRDPDLLVLDEATSALDSEAEAAIFASLERWLARRTVLLMAHRLSTVRQAGRVVVLDAGVVVGDGSVAELATGCPAFAALFADQLPGPERGAGDAGRS